MTLNPYAPPTAVVADVLPEAEARIEPPFFAVSILKFVIMSFCTFTLYDVYWFYRNWQRIRERDRVDVFPFTRAIFAVFFCYQCFARIRDYQSPAKVGPRLPAGRLAVCWVIPNLLWWLPDPYGMLTIFGFGFLVPVQEYVNRLNALTTPSHDRNARFSAWNWVAILLGGFFVSLLLLDSFTGWTRR